MGEIRVILPLEIVFGKFCTDGNASSNQRGFLIEMFASLFVKHLKLCPYFKVSCIEKTRYIRVLLTNCQQETAEEKNEA